MNNSKNIKENELTKLSLMEMSKYLDDNNIDAIITSYKDLEKMTRHTSYKVKTDKYIRSEKAAKKRMQLYKKGLNVMGNNWGYDRPINLMDRVNNYLDNN